MKNTNRTEELVDKLVKLALEATMPEIGKMGVHRFPDDDCWLSIWIAKKFIPKTTNAEVVFVNAGESLPDSDGDNSILHFDTGGGEYDHHGKGWRKTSSATILAKKIGVINDPGLRPLLEMVTAVDNIEPLPPTNMHYAINGFPRQYRDTDGTINWQVVQERVFELFEIVYGQETDRVKSREALGKYAEWTTLSNGIRVCSLLWHPECREAAFEGGAQVVVWTVSRNSKHFYTGIQAHRQYPLFLDGTAAALRSQENKTREEAATENLRSVGRIGAWYLHDSKKLILNGSRTWKPTEEEYTKLTPRQIVGLAHRSLSAIPRDIVSRWGKQR